MAEREDATRPEQAESAAEVFPPELQPVVERLRSYFPDVPLRMRADGWLEATIDRSLSPRFFETLKEARGLEFDYLSDLTAVDFEEKGFQVVYHLLSLGPRADRVQRKLAVKIQVPRDDPRTASVVHVWPTANFHEREVYDLMGVVFEGHPDLRRILLREDWVGHPLRKDYVDWRPPRPRVVSRTSAGR
ncbi:MAG: NADH-quinone oxidoreductase subunit C [Limnochordales bacterium]